MSLFTPFSTSLLFCLLKKWIKNRLIITVLSTFLARKFLLARGAYGTTRAEHICQYGAYNCGRRNIYVVTTVKCMVYLVIYMGYHGHSPNHALWCILGAIQRRKSHHPQVEITTAWAPRSVCIWSSSKETSSIRPGLSSCQLSRLTLPSPRPNERNHRHLSPRHQSSTLSPCPSYIVFGLSGNFTASDTAKHDNVKRKAYTK